MRGTRREGFACPPGFSLVELLVVVGIIALLIAMLLPAIQSTRESARRTSCAVNERGIAQGLLAYHAARRVLPPQVGWSVDEGKGAFGTVLFHLLPYLDQQVLYDRTAVEDFGSPIRTATFGSGNGAYTEYAGTHDSRYPAGSTRLPVHKATIATYRCPTEPAAELVKSRFGWAGASYGANFQILGNSGSVNVYARFSTNVDARLREWQGRTRLSRVSDGLSSTVAVAEKFGMCNSSEPGVPEFGGCMWARSDMLDFWQPTFAADRNFLGAESMFQDNPQPWTFPGPCVSAVPQTAHANGVMNCAFLDGSVRQLTAGSHAAVWWALCTPRGGEVVAVGD